MKMIMENKDFIFTNLILASIRGILNDLARMGIIKERMGIIKESEALKVNDGI